MNNIRSSLFLALLLPAMSNAQDFCGGLHNSHWDGGAVANGAMKCLYRGEGNVVQNGNQYRLTFRAQKTSGGSLCPQQIINYVFNFNCVNNQLHSNDQGIIMSGAIVNPQRVTMRGQISIFDITEVIDITAQRG